MVTGGGDRYQQLRQMVRASRSVVFFGGAGVSTESGIPDFRSSDGLYSLIYPHPPEVMLGHSFYQTHRDEFFAFYRDKVLDGILAAQPNAAHRVLAALEAAGHVCAVVTQNIDGLHQTAGSRVVYELHGSVKRNYCEACEAFYSGAELLALPQGPGWPRCARPSCGGAIKPDVVLYEEALDTGVMQAAATAIAAADVLIVGGTSLVVNPAASLIQLFKGKDLVIINKSPTVCDYRASLRFDEPIGRVLAATFADVLD